MSAIKVRKVENPTEHDIDNIAKVLAEGFADDIFSIAVCGGDKSKIYDFERATVAAVALVGELWVASYGEQNFASVAIWICPGRMFLDSDDQLEAGYNRLFGSFKPDLLEWWKTKFLPQYVEVCTKALGEDTKKENWNLQLIATLPDLQRRGLATALTKGVAEKAKANDKIITLEVEVESNLRFYQSLGWKVVYGPEHFEATEGRSFPLWVITS
ncbi:hypothetical protein PENSPDRAFT_687413 [Peniophora sp. CONT]|nr:hypothetical protein PENSPDRAFT_687413 [Peniophora sp. CONT]